MNKNFKRIISSILSAMIVLSATTAFATEVVVDDSSSTVAPIGTHGNIEVTLKAHASNPKIDGISLKLEKLKAAGGEVDPSVSVTLSTDTNGVAYFEGTSANPIPAGVYKVSFTDAALYENTSVEVTTTDLATTVKAELSNELKVAKLGSVTGKIVNTEDPAVGVPKIELALYSKTAKTAEPVSMAESGADGSFEFNDVPYGMYTIKAMNLPEGSMMTATDVEIKADTIAVKDIVISDLTKFTVGGTLTDSTDKTPIQGATFELYSYTKEDMSDATLVSELATTDKDGKFSFVDVEYVKGTKYYIKQKSTIEGQTLDTNIHKLNGTGIPTGDVVVNISSVPVSTDPTTPPTTPTTPPTTDSSGTKNPTTGDSSSMLLFLVLGLGAVGFAGSSLAKKNKKSSDA